MKLLFPILFFLSTFIGYSQQSVSKDSIRLIIQEKIKHYITISSLRKELEIIANDSMQGRKAGTVGEEKARKFLVEKFKQIGLVRNWNHKNYQQKITDYYAPNRSLTAPFLENVESKSKLIKNAYNIVGTIVGIDTINYESIVIGAHYDHIGTDGKKIYNGADDNASGTSAILELAKTFKKLSEHGYIPKRSITFVLFSAEEDGLIGSANYLAQPVLPIDKIGTMINLDMIGRVDKKHRKKPNYIYLIGSNKTYSRLKTLCTNSNQLSDLKLDFKFDKYDPTSLFSRSDHFNFHLAGIPVVSLFSGTHKDYHNPTDTSDKIEYEILENRVEYIANLLWVLANDEKLLEGNRFNQYIKEGKIKIN